MGVPPATSDWTVTQIRQKTHIQETAKVSN